MSARVLVGVSLRRDVSRRLSMGLLGLLFVTMAVAARRGVRENRQSSDGVPSSRKETASIRAGRATRSPMRPTVFSRDERSLIYTASCPIHEPTGDPHSRGLSLAWDMETGMAHCLWCGWGGRLAKPLAGRIHRRFFPKVFTLVVST